MAKNNRRFTNFLLQPSLQLRLGVVTLVVTICFSSAFIFILTFHFNTLFHSILNLTDIPDVILEEVRQTLIDTMGWLIGVLILYALTNLGISVLFTHRLVGPTIAFRRHIQSMIDGQYKSRVILRKADAFLEVADDLNKLAEKFENSSKK